LKLERDSANLALEFVGTWLRSSERRPRVSSPDIIWYSRTLFVCQADSSCASTSSRNAYNKSYIVEMAFVDVDASHVLKKNRQINCSCILSLQTSSGVR